MGRDPQILAAKSKTGSGLRVMKPPPTCRVLSAVANSCKRVASGLSFMYTYASTNVPAAPQKAEPKLNDLFAGLPARTRRDSGRLLSVAEGVTYIEERRAGLPHVGNEVAPPAVILQSLVHARVAKRGHKRPDQLIHLERVA